MEMPKPESKVVKRFEDLLPHASNVSTKKVFGHPAAFVNGNMFFGVFGKDLFVRLSASDLVEAAGTAGFHPFEPMPGRAMKGYMVLPASVLGNPVQTNRWLGKSLRFASGLPPKKPKGKAK